MDKLQIDPIGKINSTDEGIYIQLNKQYIDALRGLEGFSHMQVIWWFSKCDDKNMRQVLEMPKPYKKGPEIMGVFATRAPVRPNPIALSPVEIIEVDDHTGRIQIAWIDADDGSPVLDIKPYTPSTDKIAESRVPEWCDHWPMCYEDSGDFDWESEFNF